MTTEDFDKLQIDDFLHIKETGLEFIVVGFHSNNCVEIKSIVGGGTSTINVNSNIQRFTLGRYVSEQPQPEQHSGELKTMLIADALKLGLKKGDRVWVELEVEAFDNGDCTTAFKHPRRQSVIWLKTRSTQIIYTPQPFVPKNGEKCRFEVVNTTTDKGKILECTALHLEGNIHAFVSLSDAANGGFYEQSEIKQFLPLE